MYVFGWGGVGGIGSEWVRGLGLGFTNPGGKWEMCLCFGYGGVDVGGEWVGDLGLGGWGGMSVCVVSLDSLY